MDRSPDQFAENNVFLKDILNAGPDGEYDSANEYREPEDPHAADVLAAKRARELERDPNYVPSVEVCAQHTQAILLLQYYNRFVNLPAHHVWRNHRFNLG